MIIIAKPHKDDDEMIEMWVEHTGSLMNVTHIDNFIEKDGDHAVFVRLRDGKEVRLEVQIAGVLS